MSNHTNTLILDAIYQALSRCNTHPAACLDITKSHLTSIESLALDSLDLLQFSMDVEEALDVEMDIVDFPAEATLQEVADHFEALLTASRK